ncbi:MAG: hypothetical protein QF504_01265 [Nitrospinaceae bacterium]|nr:hypothetical protein [Nitrospinaceae bacterium]
MKRINLRGEEDYRLYRIAVVGSRTKVPHLTSIGNAETIAGVSDRFAFMERIVQWLGGNASVKIRIQPMIAVF